MNLLTDLGLDSLYEDKKFFVNTVLKYAIVKGTQLNGYYGFYVWNRLGYVELNCHIIPYEGSVRLSGFTTHVSGNNLLTLAVATNDKVEYTKSEYGVKDYLSRTVMFTNPDTHKGDIAINIVNADVAPDFYSDDKYTLQVVAIADDVTYYESEEDYCNKESIIKIMGRPVLLVKNSVISIGKKNIAAGVIKAVNMKKTYDEHSDVVELYSVEIDTCFGTIEIIHSEDKIKEGQEELIKPGKLVQAICTVLGDVAIGEYQQGAIFDEEHLVRLLRGCFEAEDFTRISQVLSEDCQYISTNGEVRAQGGTKVLKYLQDIADIRAENGLPLYAYLGEIVGYDERQKFDSAAIEYKIGTHFIALSHNDSGKPDALVFVKLNEDKKICAIKIHREKYGFYKCKINIPRNDEVEFNEENPVSKSFSEIELLDMLSKCYFNGKFDDYTFYYSIDRDCIVDNFFRYEKYTKEIKGREALFTYLSEHIPNGDAKITTEIVDGADWNHEKALKVTINGITHFSVIDVNENGSLQILHEYREDKEGADKQLEKFIRLNYNPPKFREYFKVAEFKLEESFAELLVEYMEKKGLQAPEVYRACNMTKTNFSNQLNPEHNPSKNTVLALCIGLKLNIAEANDFLARAGFAFSSANMRDVIVKYYVSEGIYDIDTINFALYDHKVTTIP